MLRQFGVSNHELAEPSRDGPPDPFHGPFERQPVELPVVTFTLRLGQHTQRLRRPSLRGVGEK